MPTLELVDFVAARDLHFDAWMSTDVYFVYIVAYLVAGMSSGKQLGLD